MTNKMEDLITLTFQGHNVNMVLINGEPWFSRVDVMKALGHPVTSHAKIAAKLKPEHMCKKRILTGQRSVTLLSEPGLFLLLMRSD